MNEWPSKRFEFALGKECLKLPAGMWVVQKNLGSGTLELRQIVNEKLFVVPISFSWDEMVGEHVAELLKHKFTFALLSFHAAVEGEK